MSDLRRPLAALGRSSRLKSKASHAHQNSCPQVCPSNRMYCTTQRYRLGPTRRSSRLNPFKKKVGTVRILPDAAPNAISSLPLGAGDHLSANTHGRGASAIQPGESEMCLLAEETEDLKSEHQKAHVGPGGDHPSFAFPLRALKRSFMVQKGFPRAGRQ
jgi:hypothetical protein